MAPASGKRHPQLHNRPKLAAFLVTWLTQAGRRVLIPARFGIFAPVSASCIMGFRRRRRRKRYTDWRQYHAEERRKVSFLYGGVDEDVRQVFFKMPLETLRRVFDDYKRQNGAAACSYAKKAYEEWKSGEVQM